MVGRNRSFLTLSFKNEHVGSIDGKKIPKLKKCIKMPNRFERGKSQGSLGIQVTGAN